MNAVLQRVAQWQQDASEEDEKYFYKRPDFEGLLSGSKLLVIGRKGSGKTAIHKYILKHCKDRSLDYRAYEADAVDYSKLEHVAKNIPQITAFWKELILSAVLDILSRRSTPLGARASWMQATQALSNLVNFILEQNFEIEVGGIKLVKNAEMDWQRRAEETRNAVVELCAKHQIKSDIFIVFDRLDQGFRNATDRSPNSPYLNSILGLVRASLELRREAQTFAGIAIRPILLMRSDIYELLQDPDRNRWGDRSINLRWTPAEIKSLIEHRISVDGGAANSTFPSNWLRVFARTQIDDRYDGEKNKDLFDFVEMRTCWRPREYIYYIRECASHAVNAGARFIDTGRVANTEFNYSTWLRGELVDEAALHVPGLQGVLDGITHLVSNNSRTRNFTKDQFSGAIGLSGGELEDRLRQLYELNVIGNSTGRGGSSSYIFPYRKDYAPAFNANGNIIIHPGFHRAML
jgi:hypothetical protein